MKYKVGQKVRIKSLDWYNKNKNNRNEITFENNPHWRFVANQSEHCGQIATITSVSKTAYRFENIPWNWTDEMIEGLVEEEVFIKANDIYNEEYSKGEYCHEQSFKWGFQEGYNYSHENDKLEISLKEGYQFKDENGNVINATKIVLEKKKKKYPKTYEECCKVLNIAVRDLDILDNMLDTSEIIYRKNLDRLLNSFRKLLICRDAYWKIAGEEMGLGKPWEPDWKKQDKKYIISVFNDTVIYFENETYDSNTLLAFPTEEMRDAFKENFDPDIEFCKEFL